MSTSAQQLARQLEATTSRVVFGISEITHFLSIAIIAKGHVLLEGVPGLGKTILAKTISAQLGGQFKRVQCTADLMPSDITGVHIYNSNEHAFTLTPGPIFTDMLLVDEINRASPKTQSALLQAMEESMVSIDRETYPLSDKFMVIATQNPYEFEGTFPLPESQLDRFLMLLDMDYLKAEDEMSILKTYDTPSRSHDIPEDLPTIPADLIEMARKEAGSIHVSDALYKYVIDIAHTSRVHNSVNLGVSNRGALGIMRCARIEAAIDAADYVSPDHVKTVCKAVIAHRLTLAPDASLEGITAANIVDEILNQVDVPREAQV